MNKNELNVHYFMNIKVDFCILSLVVFKFINQNN